MLTKVPLSIITLYYIVCNPNPYCVLSDQQVSPEHCDCESHNDMLELLPSRRLLSAHPEYKHKCQQYYHELQLNSKHSYLCPVLTTWVILRISSHSRNKKQQHFNNIKSQVTLGITRLELSWGQTRHKLRTTKYWRIWWQFLGIGKVVNGLIHTKASSNVLRQCQSINRLGWSRVSHMISSDEALFCQFLLTTLEQELKHATYLHGGLLPIHQLAIAFRFYASGSFFVSLFCALAILVCINNLVSMTMIGLSRPMHLVSKFNL